MALKLDCLQVLMVLFLSLCWFLYVRLALPLVDRTEQALEALTAVCTVITFLVAFVLLFTPTSSPKYRWELSYSLPAQRL